MTTYQVDTKNAGYYVTKDNLELMLWSCRSSGEIVVSDSEAVQASQDLVWAGVELLEVCLAHLQHPLSGLGDEDTGAQVTLHSLQSLQSDLHNE